MNNSCYPSVITNSIFVDSLVNSCDFTLIEGFQLDNSNDLRLTFMLVIMMGAKVII